jgi:acyl dehydratase
MNRLADVAYDELVVDRRFGPYEETVDEDLAGRLAGPIGAHERVTLAPPAVYPVLFLRALRRALGGIPAGAILAKQALEFHAPLRVGSVARVSTRVGGKEVRRERPFVTIEFDVRDARDAQCVTGRKVIVWPSGPRER